MGVETLVVVEDEDGMRLDRWFKHRRPDLTLGHLNKIVRTGQVRLDGARTKTSARVVPGQTVRVPPLNPAHPAAPGVRRAQPSDDDRRAIEAMVLFEDRDVLVLNKPHGLATQGGSGTTRHIDGMLESFRDGAGGRPLLVHRLDRDTSGVLLIARHRKAASALGELFRSRAARKHYWALVEGVPKPAQGRISLFLAKGDGMGDARAAGRSKGDRAMMERMRVAKHGEPDAQHSVTLYATLDRVLPRLAWLSLKPITGRTHQLRAHAEAIGPSDRRRSEIRRATGRRRAAGRPDAGRPVGRRTQAPPSGAPPRPAAPARRHARRLGATPAPHAGELGPVRLRRPAVRPHRGRARGLRTMPDIRIPSALGREPAPSRPRRFYAAATVAARDDGYALLLDGRPARTPAKRDLRLPNEPSAAALAAEWNAQAGVIDPAAMPLTRLANTAIDGVAAQMRAVSDEVKTYLSSDLLAYRAGGPASLVEAQERAWDPVIAWAREAFGARFLLAEGVTFVAQPPATLAAMGGAVDAVVGAGAAAPFRLAALHVMTTLTGSALLALSVMQGRLPTEAVWAAAHVDELFQESQWGRDQEALERRERRWAEMRAAATTGLLVG